MTAFEAKYKLGEGANFGLELPAHLGSPPNDLESDEKNSPSPAKRTYQFSDIRRKTHLDLHLLFCLGPSQLHHLMLRQMLREWVLRCEKAPEPRVCVANELLSGIVIVLGPRTTLMLIDFLGLCGAQVVLGRVSPLLASDGGTGPAAAAGGAVTLTLLGPRAVWVVVRVGTPALCGPRSVWAAIRLGTTTLFGPWAVWVVVRLGTVRRAVWGITEIDLDAGGEDMTVDRLNRVSTM